MSFALLIRIVCKICTVKYVLYIKHKTIWKSYCFFSTVVEGKLEFLSRKIRLKNNLTKGYSHSRLCHSSPKEFHIVDSPNSTLVVFFPYKTLVQTQVVAYSILKGNTRKKQTLQMCVLVYFGLK